MQARLKQKEREAIALAKVRNGNGKNRKRKAKKSLVWSGFKANENRKGGQGLGPEF
jgi:hypothetical protein